MISAETIKQVQDSATIIDVIGEFIKLKKKGVSYEAPCPFHNEKTASFKVSPTKNICKCFGCGAGGDSIWFVMKHENYTYPEAIKYLADKFGVKYVDETTAEDMQKHMALDTLFVANEFANNFFRKNLSEKPEILNYLITERRFTPETIEKWQLGFSLPDYRGFYDIAISNQYSEKSIVDAGLVYEGRDGRIIDKFRDRVTFPIHTLSGRVAGFSARILTDNKSTPKYINTAETPIYHKSDQLYGIWHAKKMMAKKNTCLLVEGQADVISMHQAGFENTVAASGTSLTDVQVNIIKRFARNIIILYDGDNAGIKATSRAIETAISGDLHVRIATLPDGDDPDSFILKYGAEALDKFIEENKKDFIEYIFSNFHLLTAEDKDMRGKITLSLIAKIPTDEIFRIREYIDKLSKLFGVTTRKIESRVAQLRNVPVQETDSIETLISVESGQIHEMAFAKALIKYGNLIYRDEKMCYFHMMENAGKIDKFLDPLARKIFQEYYDYIVANEAIPDQDFFLKHPDAQISDIATTCELETKQLSSSWKDNKPAEANYKKEIDSILLYLRLTKIKESINANQALMAAESDNEKIKEHMKLDHDLKTFLKEECIMHGVNLR